MFLLSTHLSHIGTIEKLEKSITGTNLKSSGNATELKQLSLSFRRMSKEVTYFVFAYALRLIRRDTQSIIYTL